MSGWRIAALAAALAVGVAGAAACTDDGDGGAAASALAAYEREASAEAVGAVVAAVAEHGADGDQAVEVAGALAGHLDALQRLDRPDVVRALDAVLADEEAAGLLLDALAGWVVEVVEPAVADPAAIAAAEDDLRTEVAPVLQAATAAAEEGGEPSAGAVRRAVTEPARQALAEAVAARDEQAPPGPGSFAETLSDAWPSGDPVEDLERAVADLDARLPDPEAAWPTR